MESIDLKEIVKRGKYIRTTEHPEEDLLIHNYTNACQFDKAWDKYTMMCRGLITDSFDNIIAKPFPKFFNVGEYKGKIPLEVPIVREKLDGSLGILYWSGGKPCIATRGAFESDQALWATKWFQENVDWELIDDNGTYLFEIIYPENRIVVNYDFSGLVLLAILGERPQDEVLNLNGIIKLKNGEDMRVAERQSETDLGKLVELQKDNEEGFVIHYPSTGLRLKVKFEEYVRLHRLLTQVSSKSIWELLRSGQGLGELLDKVPDEFYDWVRKKEMEFKKEYNQIDEEVKITFKNVLKYDTRKEQAMYLSPFKSSYQACVFAMLNGKDYKDIIWKGLRPKYEKPFQIVL